MLNNGIEGNHKLLQVSVNTDNAKDILLFLYTEISRQRTDLGYLNKQLTEIQKAERLNKLSQRVEDMDELTKRKLEDFGASIGSLLQSFTEHQKHIKDQLDQNSTELSEVLISNIARLEDIITPLMHMPHRIDDLQKQFDSALSDEAHIEAMKQQKETEEEVAALKKKVAKLEEMIKNPKSGRKGYNGSSSPRASAKRNQSRKSSTENVTNSGKNNESQNSNTANSAHNSNSNDNTNSNNNNNSSINNSNANNNNNNNSNNNNNNNNNNKNNKSNGSFSARNNLNRSKSSNNSINGNNKNPGAGSTTVIRPGGPMIRGASNDRLKSFVFDEKGNPIPCDDKGNPLLFDQNGKPVMFDENGNAFVCDENGNPVAPVSAFYDENGNLVNVKIDKGNLPSSGLGCKSARRGGRENSAESAYDRFNRKPKKINGANDQSLEINASAIKGATYNNYALSPRATRSNNGKMFDNKMNENSDSKELTENTLNAQQNQQNKNVEQLENDLNKLKEMLSQQMQQLATITSGCGNNSSDASNLGGNVDKIVERAVKLRENELAAEYSTRMFQLYNDMQRKLDAVRQEMAQKINECATRKDLIAVAEELMPDCDETAIGQVPCRCLACGRPRTSISQLNSLFLDPGLNKVLNYPPLSESTPPPSAAKVKVLIAERGTQSVIKRPPSAIKKPKENLPFSSRV